MSEVVNSSAVLPTDLINRFYDEMFAGNFQYALTAADPDYRSHTESCEVDPASLLESCRRMIEPLADWRREVLFEFNDGNVGVVIHRCTGRQPDGSMLNAPAVAHRVDQLFTSVAISPSGRVYMSAYAADVVSPWQTCATPASPSAVGRINCLTLGDYINNARLDYAVADLTTGISNIVTTHPINTRSQFGGGFIGDYTDIAVGSDDMFHAFWTDTNNKQSVTWWYGFQFVPTTINQEDVVTQSGSF